MSVLDVTRWDRQDASLVLGMYPLQFVSDVSQEIGAPFFATQSSRDIGFEAMRKTADFFPRGSLLPFTLNAAQPVENKTVSKMDYGNEVPTPPLLRGSSRKMGQCRSPRQQFLHRRTTAMGQS